MVWRRMEQEAAEEVNKVDTGRYSTRGRRRGLWNGTGGRKMRTGSEDEMLQLPILQSWKHPSTVSECHCSRNVHWDQLTSLSSTAGASTSSESRTASALYTQLHLLAIYFPRLIPLWWQFSGGRSHVPVSLSHYPLSSRHYPYRSSHPHLLSFSKLYNCILCLFVSSLSCWSAYGSRFWSFCSFRSESAWLGAPCFVCR